MPRLTVIAPAILALGVCVASAAEARPQAGPPPARPVAAVNAPPRSAYPIGIQLETLVDHPGTLAGQLVQLPPARVARIVSPTLVVVRDAREHGGYHFHGWRSDGLLVLLPPGTAVTKGERLVLWGDVRTVRGARLSGDFAGAGDDVLKRHGDAALLVARGVTTVDGVDLAGRR